MDKAPIHWGSSGGGRGGGGQRRECPSILCMNRGNPNTIAILKGSGSISQVFWDQNFLLLTSSNQLAH